jgi:5-methylcytosine-specific restriction protein B
MFSEGRSEFKHLRKVVWTNKGSWEHPRGNVTNSVLADITLYTEYVQRLEGIFTEEIDFTEIDNEPRVIFPTYTESDFLREVYISKERYSTVRELLMRKKNLILQGAPGVGKTFAAQRLAYSILGEKNYNHTKIVQFHQSYSYEDFVMGYRPDGSGFQLEEGPFYKFCKHAEEDTENPYFFIIDEINRGNLSKVFGELLMLIEFDKRGENNALSLLYRDEMFSVPPNVYIIGMMNTADRSLAMIDYALRRRFAFFDMEPAFSSEGFKVRIASVNNPKFDRLIACVEALNEVITNDLSLGAGFRIGHSYFCTDDAVDDLWFSSIIEYELVPLLREYWFDNPDEVKRWEGKLRDAIS